MAPGEGLDEFVYFAGEGPISVRPYVVFVFWLDMSIALIGSAATEKYRRWRATLRLGAA